MKGVAKLVVLFVKIVLKLLLYLLRKDSKTSTTREVQHTRTSVSDYSTRWRSRLRAGAVADDKVMKISKDRFTVTSTPASSGTGWSSVRDNITASRELDASNITDFSSDKSGFLLDTTVSSSSGFGSASNEDTTADHVAMDGHDITADHVAMDGHDRRMSFETEMKKLKLEKKELTEKMRKNLTLLGSSIEQTTRWRRSGGGSKEIQAPIPKATVQFGTKKQQASASIDGLVRDRLWKELLEQYDENRRLKTFVNNVMYMLLENNPRLLEV